MPDEVELAVGVSDEPVATLSSPVASPPKKLRRPSKAPTESSDVDSSTQRSGGGATGADPRAAVTASAPPLRSNMRRGTTSARMPSHKPKSTPRAGAKGKATGSAKSTSRSTSRSTSPTNEAPDPATASAPPLRGPQSRRRNSMPTSSELQELQDLFSQPSSASSPMAKAAYAAAAPQYGRRASHFLSIPPEVEKAVERMRAEQSSNKKSARFASEEAVSYTEARVDYARRASATKGMSATAGDAYRASREFYTSGNVVPEVQPSFKATGTHSNVNQIGPAVVDMDDLLPSVDKAKSSAVTETAFVMAMPISSGNAQGIVPKVSDKAVVGAVIARSAIGPEEALKRAREKASMRAMCDQMGLW